MRRNRAYTLLGILLDKNIDVEELDYKLAESITILTTRGERGRGSDRGDSSATRGRKGG